MRQRFFRIVRSGDLGGLFLVGREDIGELQVFGVFSEAEVFFPSDIEDESCSFLPEFSVQLQITRLHGDKLRPPQGSVRPVQLGVAGFMTVPTVETGIGDEGSVGGRQDCGGNIDRNRASFV